MAHTYKVAVLVGSLRKDSLNLKMAKTLFELAPPELALEIVEIRDLPLYNEDAEAAAPAAWTRFRDSIRAHDAILFVTPEYNRSVPGGLKNALDVGSRPGGQSVWSHKPAGIISVSPGTIGGFGANHHLRQSLVFLDMPILQQPEAYIAQAATLFDKAGQLSVESTREFLKKYFTAYAQWVGLNLG